MKRNSLPKPLDLCMDQMLDNKLIDVELRKEENEPDSYVKLLERTPKCQNQQEKTANGVEIIGTQSETTRGIFKLFKFEYLF